MDDLDNTRQHGFITGITDIFVRGLKQLELKRNSTMDTILYVGDSQDIKELLYGSGRKIDPVQNGMIALSAVQTGNFDAIVIEDQLPLMTPTRLLQ